jgi:hypothetical protein
MNTCGRITSLTTFAGNAEFVQKLIDTRVEFLVVGGLAMVFHKCRDPLKVDDLDLLLNPSRKNAERFIRVLSSYLELDPLPSVVVIF